MSLALPDDERTEAFRGLVAILKRDPTLKRIGMDFYAWTGSTDDGEAPAQADLPWCQLTPYAEPSTWSPTGTLDSPMVVAFDIALDGTDVADGMRVWRAFENVLYGKHGDVPGQAAALAALYAIGISSADVILPAFGIDQSSTTSQVRQRSVGKVRLQLFIPCGGG